VPLTDLCLFHTRAEAKAEGAAEAYAHAASYVRSIVRTKWSGPLLEHFDAMARGSAPSRGKPGLTGK
jgi:hypothetical protein